MRRLLWIDYLKEIQHENLIEFTSSFGQLGIEMSPPDLKSLEINRIMTGWIGSDSKNVKYNKFIKTVINFINLSDSSVKSTEVSMALQQRDSQNLNSYYWLFVRVTY